MFPLLLVPLFAVFGYHFVAMKLLVVALGLVALYLLYVFYREVAGDLTAFLVVLSRRPRMVYSFILSYPDRDPLPLLRS